MNTCGRFGSSSVMNSGWISWWSSARISEMPSGVCRFMPLSAAATFTGSDESACFMAAARVSISFTTCQ